MSRKGVLVFELGKFRRTVPVEWEIVEGDPCSESSWRVAVWFGDATHYPDEDLISLILDAVERQPILVTGLVFQDEDGRGCECEICGVEELFDSRYIELCDTNWRGLTNGAS